MFENPRRGRQARNFAKNVPKIVVGCPCFCIAQNAKWTDSENNKQGFALDVIFQNETVCNFCLKKNVLLFFREA